MSVETPAGSIRLVDGRPTMDFDHFAPDYYATWRRMATELHAQPAPIVWSEHHGGFWVVASWQAVRDIGSDWQTYTSENDLDGTGNGGRGLTIPQNQYQLYLGESDPPLHTGRRRLEAPFFTPKALHKWRPAAQRYLNEAIDRVVGVGQADLIDDIIVPTAARTTLYLLGYDPDDWEDAAAAARRTIYLLPGEEGYPHEELARMRLKFREMLVQRQAEPRDDIISHLANGVVEGAPLGLDAGESMMNALVFGGFDTTATTVGTTLLYFSDHPDMAHRFRDEESVRRNAVEELLRVFPPANGIARTAARDTELLGQRIHRGERVYLWLAAANMDPHVFRDPEVIDFDRANARDHATFSVGVHRCLGAPLAKIEIQEMLDVIPARLHNLKITTEEVERYPKGIVSGFVHIPATFSPADTAGSARETWHE